eukprot:TRINITY_DN25788_c0_g1_i1.p1 TRINITY_DN25788_c0_g1~~TRINITY_DN25788_c0_g1_i1.p1  ORF type:complete len:127 (+),score=16.45 TRINITY_DN25788_c0_g1_i1:126-506(+)
MSSPSGSGLPERAFGFGQSLGSRFEGLPDRSFGSSRPLEGLPDRAFGSGPPLDSRIEGPDAIKLVVKGTFLDVVDSSCEDWEQSKDYCHFRHEGQKTKRIRPSKNTRIMRKNALENQHVMGNQGFG